MEGEREKPKRGPGRPPSRQHAWSRNFRFPEADRQRLVKYENVSIHVNPSTMLFMKRLRALAILLLLLPAAHGCKNTPPTAEAPGLAQLPVGSMPKIDQQKILDHIKVLSSDEYQGRRPGTKGEELSVNYIEGQFKQLSLK